MHMHIFQRHQIRHKISRMFFCQTVDGRYPPRKLRWNLNILNRKVYIFQRFYISSRACRLHLTNQASQTRDVCLIVSLVNWEDQIYTHTHTHTHTNTNLIETYVKMFQPIQVVYHLNFIKVTVGTIISGKACGNPLTCIGWVVPPPSNSGNEGL